MRNKKTIIVALILLLAIGFASITTTLVINQTSNIGKAEDFSVIFTSAVLDGEKSDFLIKNDGKKIEFSTKELMKVGDTSVLNYEVTNNSANYDARITIDCEIPTSDYYEVTNTTPSVVKAKSGENGSIKVELKKVSVSEEYTENFICTLNVSAIEKSEVGVETYSVSGILKDNNGNILPNQTVAVFSTPKVTKTDEYGYFYVGGLESGSHNIYVLSGSVEDYTSKTEEEIEELTSEIISRGTITTEGVSSITNNYTINEAPIGTPEEYTITYNLDGGTGSNPTSYNILSEDITLTEPTKEGYRFAGWIGSNGSTPEINVTISKGSTGAKNYTANWKEVVTFKVDSNQFYTYNGVESGDKCNSAGEGCACWYIYNNPSNFTYGSYTNCNVNQSSSLCYYWNGTGDSWTNNSEFPISYLGWEVDGWYRNRACGLHARCSASITCIN